MNFFIIASYHAEYRNEFPFHEYEIFYRDDDHDNISLKSLIYSSYIQLGVTCLVLVNYFITKVPNYFKIKYDSFGNPIKSNQLFRFFEVFNRMIDDWFFIFYFICFGFSLLGVMTNEYFYFCFPLLEIFFRSRIVKNIIEAVVRREIIWTLLLFLIVEIFFTAFIYLYYYDNMPGVTCYTFVMCFTKIIDYTMKVNFAF